MNALKEGTEFSVPSSASPFSSSICISFSLSYDHHSTSALPHPTVPSSRYLLSISFAFLTGSVICESYLLNSECDSFHKFCHTPH